MVTNPIQGGMLGSPFAAMGLANLAQQFGSGGELKHFVVFKIAYISNSHITP